MEKRVAILYMTVAALFLTLILRLYSLTFSRDLVKTAVGQSTYTVDVTTTRGAIYDCRGQRMTDPQWEYAAAVSPSPEAMEALADHITGPSRSGIFQQVREGLPFLCNVGKAPVYGAGIKNFKVYDRYGAHPAAPHVLGYLNGDGTGAAGIEAAFQDQLAAEGEKVSVRYGVDIAQNPLEAVAPQVTGSDEPPKAGVILTLDQDIQRIVETVTRQEIPKGAAVVMDVHTGELRAVASAPGFSPDHVAESLNDPSAPLLNRAFCGYNVGSTFKLAVAAAALEQGISPSFSHECVGGVDVDGRIFYCHNRAGHGLVQLEEAIEKSCNPYFIRLGQETGGENIVAMAKAMGFGKETQLAPGMTSAQGNLPDPSEVVSPMALANLSFGQGTLVATPVQVAAMVSSIANGGNSVRPSLVKGWTEDGSPVKGEVYGSARIMSPRTAELLKNYMIQVVEEGSGTAGKPSEGGAGGKTASAQTGTYDEAGNEIVHACFAGFFPAEEPKYAVVVLVEGGEFGGKVASPIFKRMAEQVTLLEQERQEAAVKSQEKVIN